MIMNLNPTCNIQVLKNLTMNESSEIHDLERERPYPFILFFCNTFCACASFSNKPQDREYVYHIHELLLFYLNFTSFFPFFHFLFIFQPQTLKRLLLAVRSSSRPNWRKITLLCKENRSTKWNQTYGKNIQLDWGN